MGGEGAPAVHGYKKKKKIPGGQGMGTKESRLLWAPPAPGPAVPLTELTGIQPEYWVPPAPSAPATLRVHGLGGLVLAPGQVLDARARAPGPWASGCAQPQGDPRPTSCGLRMGSRLSETCESVRTLPLSTLTPTII